MPAVQYRPASETELIGYAELGPQEAEQTIGLFLPHAQGWKPSMYMRAEFARQVVNPDAKMLVFPNGDNYYQLNPWDKQSLSQGDFTSLSEKFTRVIETKAVGQVALTGYSLGGLLAPNVAAVGSGAFEVTHVNSDEAPARKRTAKQLQKDFMDSGAWSDQKHAIQDAGIPALAETLNTPRLAIDYARFGVQALTSASLRRVHEAMAATDLVATTRHLRQSNPEISIKYGRIAGSLLSDPEQEDREHGNFRIVTYGKTPQANRKHTTGDNIVAHALMVRDGLSG